jgi:hypothetical protein
MSYLSDLLLSIAPQLVKAQLSQNNGGDWGGSSSNPDGLSGSATDNGAGVQGLMGLFGSRAANGDSGLTNQVANQPSGLPAATQKDMGDALGSAPTGLFSGLLPGGGMSQTESGALGGGLSGQTAGAAGIGGSSMNPGTGIMSALPGLLSQAAGAQQAGQGQQAGGMVGRAHTGNATMAQLAGLYGLPSGLLATNRV